MPTSANTSEKSDGPWGEAIEYWLKDAHASQADLVRAAGLQPNTISRVVRGFDTTTKVLRAIAKAFGRPLEQILVSPERRLSEDDRNRIARHAAEIALRQSRETPPAQQVNRVGEEAKRASERARARKKLPKKKKKNNPGTHKTRKKGPDPQNHRSYLTPSEDAALTRIVERHDAADGYGRARRPSVSKKKPPAGRHTSPHTNKRHPKKPPDNEAA